MPDDLGWSWWSDNRNKVHNKHNVLESPWSHLSPPLQFSSVQSVSRVRLFATPWTAAHQASLSITNSRSLLKLMSIESVMPSNHLILCRFFLLPPSIFPPPPSLWKNCLPQNWSLVPKRLGTAALGHNSAPVTRVSPDYAGLSLVRGIHFSES